MITFNISWETLRYIIAKDNGALYFKESEIGCVLYYVQNNNVMLTYTYMKVGSEQDLIWKEDNLKNAIRVVSMNEQTVKFQIIQ